MSHIPVFVSACSLTHIKLLNHVSVWSISGNLTTDCFVASKCITFSYVTATVLFVKCVHVEV